MQSISSNACLCITLLAQATDMNKDSQKTWRPLIVKNVAENNRIQDHNRTPSHFSFNNDGLETFRLEKGWAFF